MSPPVDGRGALILSEERAIHSAFVPALRFSETPVVEAVKTCMFSDKHQIYGGNPMTRVADGIMKRVRAHGRGRWVCTPKDFLDLGSRQAIDQALSRLVKAGRLRRAGRGLYDLPRMSGVLKQPAPVDLDAAVAALARRDGIRVMPDGAAAAHGLGLTNAVPAKACYATDGASRTVEIDGRTIRFRHAGPRVMRWAGRPGAPVAQALRWLGPDAAADARVVSILKRRLPDAVKQDLSLNGRDLPGWALPLARDIVSDRAAAA